MCIHVLCKSASEHSIGARLEVGVWTGCVDLPVDHEKVGVLSAKRQQDGLVVI